MYDPLGMISSITVQFKILFQELCKDKKDWDEPLEGSCKSAWYWIVQSQKEWKPFVQHLVDEIRKLVPEECWNHCPGADNPADLLSRGMDCRELENSVLWWNGPEWLTSFEGLENRKEITEEQVPEACLVEMRAKDRKTVTTAFAMNSEPAMLCNIIQSEAFSNLGRLLRFTDLVLKFIKLLKAQRLGNVNHKPEIHVTGADIEEAELLWIEEIQREMMSKDGQSRGAEVRVQGRGSRGGGLLRRPLQLLYPLKVSCSTNEAAPQEQVPESPEQPKQGRARGNRERCRAAVEGGRIRRQWIAQLQDEH